MEGGMSYRILIKAGAVTAEGVLNDTPTAKAIWDALPLTGKANTWGDEIYFAIPVKQDLEPTAQEIVDLGDLGYWPSGRAFCIFFGPTPASTGNEIRPASAVNMIGRVEGDPTVFKQVKDGARVQIDPA
jgi:uncharacterized protein